MPNEITDADFLYMRSGRIRVKARAEEKPEPKYVHPKAVELVHLAGKDFAVKLDNGNESVGILKGAHDGTLFLSLPNGNVKVTLQQVKEAIQGESI